MQSSAEGLAMSDPVQGPPSILTFQIGPPCLYRELHCDSFYRKLHCDSFCGELHCDPFYIKLHCDSFYGTFGPTPKDQRNISLEI